MIPNVYEQVWNVLLKVYSSLNMHHLIRERFHEGLDLSVPGTHPGPPTPDEYCADGGYL